MSASWKHAPAVAAVGALMLLLLHFTHMQCALSFYCAFATCIVDRPACVRTQLNISYTRTHSTQHIESVALHKQYGMQPNIKLRYWSQTRLPIRIVVAHTSSLSNLEPLHVCFGNSLANQRFALKVRIVQFCNVMKKLPKIVQILMIYNTLIHIIAFECDEKSASTRTQSHTCAHAYESDA